MSSEDDNHTERAAMAKESQYKLLEALKAHISDLEAERDRASGRKEAVLEQRLKAAGKALDWLSTRIEASNLKTAPIYGSQLPL
jgi:hypothetical protein